MQVFYKVKYENNGIKYEKEFNDLTIVKKVYNELSNSANYTNVKLFIVNEVEEELLADQIPND